MPDPSRFLGLTADIVTAHVAHNTVSDSDLPALIANVHAALAGLEQRERAPGKQEPAVSIRASIKPDYLVCLEDGKRLKLLKAHLRRHYGLSPDEYRAKWGLPSTYPMVAPNYSARRAELAKASGLGKDGGRSKSERKGAKSKKAAR
ncbi:MucR family transcriptional regulator [Sphingomonas rhizophila]|uniref:MucR family transcriptional regulator n=1 Tax=Sphingomonas rhizophila TaxID=2071607 RepID=A0A7G9SBP2_9SPHN|nr:MucR family transcriptional regulator [Sphingomonas rhizophila]QNN65267.1 MucR family transcriptional regulator [Sphingomonas rhizophila]